MDVRACDALVGEIPSGCVAVAESGIRSAGDIRHLRAIGYQAFLVGEWLMSQGDPRATLASAAAWSPDP